VKSKNSITHKSFKYDYSKKRSTNVEFDVIDLLGKKMPVNIILSSNWRAYHPKNLQISLNSRGEYGFLENGVTTTNGDIQQIIKRILELANEAED
jgi:hypothetical protein